jgi:hypothetical protein
MAVFVCATTVESLTHTAVLHHPEMLGDDRAEAFVASQILGDLRKAGATLPTPGTKVGRD